MQMRQSRSPLLPWELGVASASGVWEPDLDFSEHTTALRSDVSKLLLQPPPAHSMEEETEVLGGRRLPAAACSPVCWPSCWARGRRYPGEALPCLPGTRLCLRLTDQASPTSENPRTITEMLCVVPVARALSLFRPGQCPAAFSGEPPPPPLSSIRPPCYFGTWYR